MHNLNNPEKITCPEACIGKQVFKHSNKPFKSTLKINTVLGVIQNPHTGKAAFTFVEDDSMVDVDQCRPYEKT